MLIACTAYDARPASNGNADSIVPSATQVVADSRGYVGSAACAECHEKEYRKWKASLHSKMEQIATPETVIAPFTEAGVVMATEAAGGRVVMKRVGERFSIEAPDAQGRPTTYAIDRTIGNRYRQRYVTQLPDGSWRVLPVQWLIKDQKFVEPMHLASTKPGSGDYWIDEAWQWQLKCAGCHTTSLDLGYDAAAKRYDTKWKELAIGCESCHGPSVAHVGARGGKQNVICPSNLPLDRQLDACGKCHSRGSAGPVEGAPAGLPTRIAYPYNMLPGTALDSVYTSVTLAKNPKEFWPDGSSKNHHQQFVDYRNAPMRIHGGPNAPSCTTCHDPHDANALKKPIENNALCVSCHKDFAASEKLAAHTGHGSDPIANTGARCVECHMPRTAQHAGTVKLRSHDFWNPDAKRARDTQSPDACLICHKEKDSAWSESESARIWKK